tara:strand:+ start:208 stop:474 length:267 start_codon:yes stop_codon:yes gene_type:complete
MGTLISDATTGASCGDAQTGSSRVLVQGNGACRVNTDTAGGLIVGPGSSKVKVEGDFVSIKDDAIAPHGLSPHDAPITKTTQDRVFAG